MVSASFAGLRLGRLGVMLGVTTKLPVTDTASLGTGAWDVGGSLSASLSLGRRAFLSLDVAYWHLGDPPGLDVADPLVFGGSASWLGGGWGLSAGISGGTSTIPGFAPPVSVTASILHLRDGGGVGVLATAGLTETAPDVTVALSWRLALLD